MNSWRSLRQDAAISPYSFFHQAFSSPSLWFLRAGRVALPFMPYLPLRSTGAALQIRSRRRGNLLPAKRQFLFSTKGACCCLPCLPRPFLYLFD